MKIKINKLLKENNNVQQIDIGNNRFQINLENVPGPQRPERVRSEIMKLISDPVFQAKINALAIKLYDEEDARLQTSGLFGGKAIHARGAGKHHGGKELLTAITNIVNNNLFGGHKVLSVYDPTGLFGRSVTKTTEKTIDVPDLRRPGSARAWELKPWQVDEIKEEIRNVLKEYSPYAQTPSPQTKLASHAKAQAKKPSRTRQPKGKKASKFKGIKIPHESKWPDQIKRQIAHLKDAQDRWFGDAGINENFLIVDDYNKKLYVFSPQFELLANLPVITGRDAGEEDVLEMKDWLMENGWFDYYNSLIDDIKAGGSRGRVAQGEKKKMFDMFLKHASKAKTRVTPSGVFTLANLKKGKEIKDRVSYGTRKYSLRPGADTSEFVPVSGIALHGTGMPDRNKAFSQATAAIKKGKEVRPVLVTTPSFGCVNVQNRYLNALDKLIGEGSQVFILPEDGSIVEVGRFENAGHYLDAAVELGGKCIDAITGKRSSSKEDIKKFKKLSQKKKKRKKKKT